MKLPFTIETKTGGFNVRSLADLRRLAMKYTRLSPGFIGSATVSDLLPHVCRAVDGEVSPT